MSLEEKMSRLESIIQTLDQEDTTLDEGIDLYQQGLTLTKTCLQELNAYKGKINEIKLEMDSLLEKPFEKE